MIINILTVFSGGNLLIGTQTYLVGSATPAPTAAPTNVPAANGPGVYTIKGPNSSPIALSFTPSSSSVTCNVIGCQTIYYGPNTQATLLAPGGIYVSTTATAVLYGTVAGQLVPTFTTYAEVTREAGAVAKPTGLAVAA